MAHLLYNPATKTPAARRPDIGFPVWTRLSRAERKTLFAVRDLRGLRQFALAARALARQPEPIPGAPLPVASPRRERTLKPPAFKKAPPVRAKPVARPSASLWVRVKDKIYSAEFWLGLFAGAATRVATRAIIEEAFASSHGFSAAFAGFVACATAGVAAGMIVHMVRVGYRNAARVSGAPKERYISAALFESAVTGLFAGLIGGYMSGVGSATARTATFAVGGGSGAAVGVFHAVVKSLGAARSKDGQWKRRILYGAGYGAVGGVLGVFAIDAMGPHSSMAATMNPPSSSPALDMQIILPEHCRTSVCTFPLGGGVQQVPATIAPVESVTVAVAGAPGLHPLPVLDPCVPHHIAHHWHHHYHRAQARHPERPLFDTVVVIDLPPPPPIIVAPVHVVIPISGPLVAPPPQAPCDYGTGCEPPCPDQNLPVVQGPCADPGVICAERVSFNGDGDATHAVLEPVAAQNDYAHFEVDHGDVGSDGSRVSLLMPFANRNPAYAEPMPA